MFNYRFLEKEDYTLLQKWWKDWGWTPIERDFLPLDGLGGILVFVNEKPVCAGFLYFTNSKVAWLEFIISDKNYKDKKQKTKAIDSMILKLEEVAKGNNVKYLYTTTNEGSLKRRYEKLGYFIGTKGTDEYLKKL